MVATESSMMKLGTIAPQFTLPNFNPNYSATEVSLSDFNSSKGIVVAFICNHCPFVVNLKTAFAEFAEEYQAKEISVIAISANDISSHPADGPDKMTKDAVQWGYTFPYLYDESQDTAKAYEAACTPDIYLFGSKKALVYRGQFDDSRPGNGISPTGSSLRSAADALLAGHGSLKNQRPSIGCNIKWKSSN